MKEEGDSDLQVRRETGLGLSTTQGDSSEQQGGSGDKASMCGFPRGVVSPVATLHMLRPHRLFLLRNT